MNVCDDVISDFNFVSCVVEKEMTREKPLDSRQQVFAEVYANKVKEETMNAVHDMQDRTLDLLEICAPWDSPLSEEYKTQGGRVERLGLHNGYDLSTRTGYRKAVAFLKEHIFFPALPDECVTLSVNSGMRMKMRSKFPRQRTRKHNKKPNQHHKPNPKNKNPSAKPVVPREMQTR